MNAFLRSHRVLVLLCYVLAFSNELECPLPRKFDAVPGFPNKWGNPPDARQERNRVILAVKKEFVADSENSFWKRNNLPYDD